MAESQNTETAITQEIQKTVKDVIENIINNIDYDVMETELGIFDDFREEPTVADLAGLLYCATQFEGGGSSENLKPDDDSSSGPFERIKEDVVTVPAMRAPVEAPSDEAEFVTPVRGAEVKNSYGDLIGWLDPGATLAKRAAPRRRTGSRIASAAWTGITKAARVFCCCSPK